MTPTEQRAYAWLVRERGYAPSDIAFQFRTSPDFRTADWRGWEVKRLSGKSATFYVSQVARFRVEPPTVLLWYRDRDLAPQATFDFRDLPMPGYLAGYQIHVRYQSLRGLHRNLHTPFEVTTAIAEWLIDRAERHPRYQRPMPYGPSELAA